MSDYGGRMERREVQKMTEVSFKKIMENPPRCPLCFGVMKVKHEPLRKIWILHCERDDIAIAVTDPLVGKWEEKMEKIPCPNCGTHMRVFFTSTGFMKALCPAKKCGCTVRGSNPDRLAMAPALRLDGMDTQKEGKA